MGLRPRKGRGIKHRKPPPAHTHTPHRIPHPAGFAPSTEHACSPAPPGARSCPQGRALTPGGQPRSLVPSELPPRSPSVALRGPRAAPGPSRGAAAPYLPCWGGEAGGPGCWRPGAGRGKDGGGWRRGCGRLRFLRLRFGSGSAPGAAPAPRLAPAPPAERLHFQNGAGRAPGDVTRRREGDGGEGGAASPPGWASPGPQRASPPGLGSLTGGSEPGPFCGARPRRAGGSRFNSRSQRGPAALMAHPRVAPARFSLYQPSAHHHLLASFTLQPPQTPFCPPTLHDST